MSDLSADLGHLDDVIEGAEIAAEFLGDVPDDGDVLAHEFPCHLDKRRDGTPCYIRRRVAEGKTRREAIRCLKRYVCREICRDITLTKDQPAPASSAA